MAAAQDDLPSPDRVLRPSRTRKPPIRLVVEMTYDSDGNEVERYAEVRISNKQLMEMEQELEEEAAADPAVMPNSPVCDLDFDPAQEMLTDSLDYPVLHSTDFDSDEPGLGAGPDDDTDELEGLPLIMEERALERCQSWW
jgi:hypothetical protein